MTQSDTETTTEAQGNFLTPADAAELLDEAATRARNGELRGALSSATEGREYLEILYEESDETR